MTVLLIIFLNLLRFVAMANVLIFFAIDYKSVTSIVWFIILIVVSIAHALVEKMIGQHFSTLFDKPIPHIVLNGVLLILTVLMYLANKDHLSVFYLLIFGAHLASQIYLHIKMVNLPAEKKNM